MGSSSPSQVPVGSAALNPTVPGVSQGPYPTMPNQPGTTGALSVGPSGNYGGGIFGSMPGAMYSPGVSSISGPSPLQLGSPQSTPAPQQATQSAPGNFGAWLMQALEENSPGGQVPIGYNMPMTAKLPPIPAGGFGNTTIGYT